MADERVRDRVHFFHREKAFKGERERSRESFKRESSFSRERVKKCVLGI